MKTIVVTLLLGLAALMLAGCATPATNTPATADANAPKPAVAAPTADALFALDKQANEAYFKSDAEFFEKTLSDKFVMHEDGHRMDKAAVVKMIAGNKCEGRGGKFEEPQLARIDADTYVLSYKGTFDGSCTGPDGKAMKIPSPIRAATVWVRSGDRWLAAYHGGNLIIDPKNPPAKVEGKKDRPKQDDNAAADTKTVATRPTTDPNTDALMATERSLWEAWMAKDAKKIEALTTKDLSFQNIFGTYFSDKADAMKDWTGSNCNVTSVSVADGASSSISPTVAILTSKGTAVGACGGQKSTVIRVYGTSIYVKDGGSWKLAFGLNRPLN